MKKKFTLLIAALLTSLGFSATAAVGDVITDGTFRYRIIAEGDVNEVEITTPESGAYDVSRMRTTLQNFRSVTNDGITYTVVGIGKYAFKNAQFPYASEGSQQAGITNLPNTLRYIDDYAFESVKSGNPSTNGPIRFYGNIQTVSSTAFVGNRIYGGILVSGGTDHMKQVGSTLYRGSVTATIYAPCLDGTEMVCCGNAMMVGGGGVYEPGTKIVLSEDFKIIGEHAFEGNNQYTTIEMTAVENIKSQAFKNTVFQTVIIPATCTTIAADAFEGATAISRITCNAATPPAGVVFDDAVYARIRQSGNITVPADALEAYQADPNWYKFWSETPPAPPVTRVYFAEAENGEVTADNLGPAGGATVTLTVTPAAGYKLESIRAEAFIDSENAQAPRRIEGPEVGLNVELTPVVEGQTYTFVMPEEPYKVLVTPEFAPARYTITVAETENGTVVADKAEAAEGETVTLTVTPAEGYELTSLTYTAEGAEPVAIENGSFTMPAANVTINATFAEIPPVLYTITVAETENGTVVADKAEAEEGETVTLTVTPAEGYELTSLTYTAEGAEPVAIENGSFTMPAANVTINATFAEIPPVLYTVTVAETENGTVTADKAEAAEGETVTLTVTPAEGYQLETLTVMNGEEEVEVVDNAFTMPAGNVTVTATFAEIPPVLYTITVAETENGTVTADKAEAAEGETVTLTVTPAEGYQLETLTVMNGEEEVEVVDNAFTMPAGNVTVTATFAEIPPVLYTVTYTAQLENGTVAVAVGDTEINSGDAVAAGETVSITITPAEGYVVESVTVETASGTETPAAGAPAHRAAVDVNGSGNNYSFVMPEEPVTIDVTLVQNTITGVNDLRVNSDNGVKYVNPMGQVSNRPFKGVNIVVDGGKTYKVIKN